jgi:hypothetical protein
MTAHSDANEQFNFRRRLNENMKTARVELQQLNQRWRTSLLVCPEVLRGSSCLGVCTDLESYAQTTALSLKGDSHLD